MSAEELKVLEDRVAEAGILATRINKLCMGLEESLDRKLPIELKTMEDRLAIRALALRQDLLIELVYTIKEASERQGQLLDIII